MDAHVILLAALMFLFVFFVIIAILRLGLSPRNPISLVSPGAEIDQLATIRTKRTVWIILPRTLVAASGAFHP
jgi:hypothetical protein